MKITEATRYTLIELEIDTDLAHLIAAINLYRLSKCPADYEGEMLLLATTLQDANPRKDIQLRFS